MILLKKFLLMNFSAPCRQSGLYAFLSAMGSPEEEDNRPVKLMRFKKMSSTPELDKYDDEDQTVSEVIDSDELGSEEDEVGKKTCKQDESETGTGCKKDESEPGTSKKTESEAGTSKKDKNEPGKSDESLKGSRRKGKRGRKAIRKRKEMARKIASDGDELGKDNERPTCEVNTEGHHTSKVLSDVSQDSMEVDTGADEDHSLLDRTEGDICDGLSRETFKLLSQTLEHNCVVGDMGGSDGECVSVGESDNSESGANIMSGVNEVVEGKTPADCHSDEAVGGAREEGVELKVEPSVEPKVEFLLGSDDQDSLHLSDVEDAHSSFTCSTVSSASTSSATTPSTSSAPLDLTSTTGIPSSPSLDLSDLLRISEDVLSQSPGKTLNILQRHLEKGGTLLQEASTGTSGGEEEASVRQLAGALHLHLTQFTDSLHHTRDRLEDTARCYHLLDKAYEWALEAMKVVGRVKGEGLASPEQVGSAARALTAHLEEHPPIPDHTFQAMTDLATSLNNHTLLQQCKMAQVRCQETNELLRTRQAALQKAKRQMEFDCQSYVDLGEVFGAGGGEEQLSSPLAWLACSPLNASGRRRSVSSIGSRNRESLSRCASLDTDDDSVFMETPPPPPPNKTPLEARTSLGGIKEVRESAEDLQQSPALSTPTTPTPSTNTTSPPTTSSSSSSGTSGTSSCSSSDSSGPVSSTTKFMKRANTWQYGLISKDHENSSLDDGEPRSPTSHKNIPPSYAVNSHLLIRGSQLNLSFNTEDLSQEEVKKSKTLLLIMRELIQTETDYVNSLEYIIENYIPELMREDIPQCLRGQRNVVFGNIEKIYEFHSGYFLRALEACEMRPFTVGSIFLRYEHQFYLYALYNKNKPKSDSLMSEYGSAFFRKKQLELGDKMDLASYLLKPVQRMGKYALMLKQLLKECGRGEESHEELKGAQEMVQFQLRHGNDLLAMDSLRDCDVNLKEQGRLLRQGEFLVWEGSRAKKAVRHVFLFEEMILFSKARRDPEKKTLDIFQYKHSMKMTDIGLTEQIGVSVTKFEIWFRKRKPSDTYLLQASNPDMKESWTEEISKLLWRQALRNRTMRLHEMSSMGIGNKPCLDIRPSEDQISDRSISINQLHKAPRLRSGSTCTASDVSSMGGAKRPHSIISVSSSSASSSSASSSTSSHSSAVCPTYVGALNLGFESGDSPRALHRSVTRTSQCSAESGILADMYPGGEDESQCHRRVERSNSTITTLSVDSALSPSSSTSFPSSTCPLTSPTSSLTSPTSSLASPISPLGSPMSPLGSPISPLSTVSSPRSTDVIYEAHVLPPTKDSAAKTLLTTEV